jgi:hypothetical protein
MLHTSLYLIHTLSQIHLGITRRTMGPYPPYGLSCRALPDPNPNPKVRAFKLERKPAERKAAEGENAAQEAAPAERRYILQNNDFVRII